MIPYSKESLVVSKENNTSSFSNKDIFFILELRYFDKSCFETSKAITKLLFLFLNLYKPNSNTSSLD